MRAKSLETSRQAKLRAYWRLVKDLQFTESERKGKLVPISKIRKMFAQKKVLSILKKYDTAMDAYNRALRAGKKPRAISLKLLRDVRKTLILLGYKHPDDETLPGETP